MKTTKYPTPDGREHDHATLAVLYYHTTMFCTNCEGLSNYHDNNGRCPYCGSTTYPLARFFPERDPFKEAR